MEETRIHLAVIIGSTRKGRIGDSVARWFAEQATGHGAYDLDVIDLIEYYSPDASPTNGTHGDLHARLDNADAFVVVTPEYNHGYPAPLKAAIDSARREWAAKPVALLSYGALSGGIRAAEQLRQVFAELHTMTIRNSVAIRHPWNRLDDNNTLIGDDETNAAAKLMLEQLAWWSRALSDARAKRPYAA